MKVHWDRVVSTVLVVTVLVFGAGHCSSIGHFFDGMRHIGSHDREQHVMGLIAFGVLLVLLAILSQIVKRRDSE